MKSTIRHYKIVNGREVFVGLETYEIPEPYHYFARQDAYSRLCDHLRHADEIARREQEAAVFEDLADRACEEGGAE